MYGFVTPFLCSFIFLPVHHYFYTSTTVFTRPNDGWTDLCIKLCVGVSWPELHQFDHIQHLISFQVRTILPAANLPCHRRSLGPRTALVKCPSCVLMWRRSAILDLLAAGEDCGRSTSRSRYITRPCASTSYIQNSETVHVMRRQCSIV